jgi:hypothetical protein
MKIETFGEPGYTWELPFECEIHCCAPRANPVKSRFSVLNLTPEPPEFMMSAKEVIKIAGFFDVILTYDEELLKLPNAKKLNYGNQWVSGVPCDKNFSISFLYSRGIGTELIGYQFRRAVWDNKEKITMPKRFWTSTAGIRAPVVTDLAPYPFEKKDPLFESMFSVIIENSKANNYFSEKLLDALRTYTVPIYFGCPNISDYFDSGAIVPISNIEELLFYVNNLTPDDYWSLMGSMINNYKTAESYVDYGGRMKDIIINAYNEKFVTQLSQ